MQVKHFSIVSFFLFCLTLMPVFGQNVSVEEITTVETAANRQGTKAGDGNRSVVFSKDKLIVVNKWIGLQIIDVSIVDQPKQVGVYRTASQNHSAIVDNNDIVYLAADDDGVYIIDISTPSNPRSLFRIRTKGTATAVALNGTTLAITEGNSQISIYDVTDVKNPTQTRVFQVPTWTWEVAFNNGYLFVGSKSRGFYVYDLSSASDQYAYHFNFKGDVRDFVFDGTNVYVAAGAAGLKIINVNNPLTPELIANFDAGGYLYDIFKVGDYIYAANEKDRKLQVINIADPANIEVEYERVFDQKVYGVTKDKIYVYMTVDRITEIMRYNNPPRFVPIGDKKIDENQELAFEVKAFDPDGDKVTITAANLPQGSSFDSLNVFRWTPTYEQSEIYPGIHFTVVEHTETQLKTETDISIFVNHVNRSPELAAIEDQVIDENQQLVVKIPEGTDPDKEDKGLLTHRIDNLPEGATFDAEAMELRWLPTFDQSGEYNPVAVVSDPGRLEARSPFKITVNHVDRPPVVAEVEKGYSVDENKPIVISFEGSDPDTEDQNVFNWRAKNVPEGANFDATALKLSWTPTFEQSGNYTDVTILLNTRSFTDSVVFNIGVNHVNRTPQMVAIPDQNGLENVALSFAIETSDPDREDDGKLVLTAENVPDGAVFDAAKGTLNWLPTFVQSGTYQPKFIITDPSGLTAEKIAKITIGHVNRLPVLDSLPLQVIDENTLLSFKVTGSDPDIEDANTQKYSAADLPQGAQFDAASQTFTWTPTFDQSGDYTVSFTLEDGAGGADTKTVNLKVNHVNRPPAIAEVQPQTVDENKVLTFAISGSDEDVEDQQRLVLTAPQLPEGAVFDAATATFTWTPTYEQSGAYKAVFKIDDGAGMITERTVEMTVNHVNRAPVWEDLPVQTIPENQPLTIALPVAVEADKEDTDKVKYALLNAPKGSSFDAATRTLTWTPDFDQSGSYNLEFTVTDGLETIQKSMAITVTHVNREPAIADIQPQIVDENKTLTFKVVDSDPDTEDAGKLQVSTDGMPEGAAFDPQTRTFTWTPTFEQSGEYTVNFTVTDPAGLNAGNSAKVTVTHVNRAPLIEAVAPITANENEVVAFALAVSDPDAEDAGQLEVTIANLPETASFSSAAGFTWTPSFVQSGAYNLNATVIDPGGLKAETVVTLTINHVNRSPEIGDVASQVVDENNRLEYTLPLSDPDAEDEGKLVYQFTNLPDGASQDGATVRWTPGFAQSGTYTVNFSVADPAGLSQNGSFDITVNHVNRAPELQPVAAKSVAENATLTFTLQGTDPDVEDEGKLTYQIENIPANASLNEASGEFSWTPDFTQAGSYNLQALVTDESGLQARQTVAVTVTNVNREPELPEIDDQNIKEDETLRFTVVASDDDAEDIDKLRFSVSPQPDGLTISGDEVIWQPGFDQSGTYNLTITVTDPSGASAAQSFSIAVADVNRNPVVSASDVSAVAGESVNFTVNASDADGDNLSFALSGDVESGMQLDNSGRFSWSQATAGSYDLTITVTDGKGGEAETSVTVEVSERAVPGPGQ
jgi:hypothetical protein